MKHILEFDSFEHADELCRVIHSGDMASLIWEWQQHLRQLYRYDDERLDTMSAHDLIEEMYGENGSWWEMKDKNDVNIDKLWS